jgi:two-component system, LytTR family, response regulator
MQHFKEEKTVSRFLLIKADYRIVQIPFEDIIFIEGLSAYVKINTPGKKYITLAALKDIEQQLPATEFTRIHNSYLLAKKSIASYNAASVTLRNQSVLPVGRKYKENFLRGMQS